MSTLFLVTLFTCYVTVHAVTTCEQGKNCNLPECYCGSAGIPAKINSRDVPQMVIVAVEGNLDNHRDKHYEKLFPNHHRNPNGCPTSATFFVSGQSTDVNLVKKWYDRGIEIALNSQLGAPSYNYWFTIKRQNMKREVLVPLDKFTRDDNVPRKDIRGYRNPAFFAAGNIQYQVLEYEGFEYDATLRVRRGNIYETNIWPSTLDFPWGYRCDVGKCPTNSYPGLWIVPSVTLFNGTEANVHSSNLFVHSTSFPATTRQEMFDFLWNNFNAFYEKGRAPFILNVNTVGFLGDGGEERLKAYQQFFAKALEQKGVFFISMHQLIQWMKKPTKLKDINTFLPWSCRENSPEFQESKRKGTPVELRELDRGSKLQALYGRSDSNSVQGSLTLLLLLPVLYVIKQWNW